MKIKKEDVIISLLLVIVVLLVVRRLRSDFTTTTPPADLLIRPQNIGKDIDITATKWTNIANYKPGDPGDETKAWYEINNKAWSIPGCWGFRKVLQAGGGGAVGYILSAPVAADYSRDCGVIDTVVLADGALHAVPDALVCQLSAADPVPGTDCVWSLGTGSKWIISSPAAHGGACGPAPAPVSFVTNEYFAGAGTPAVSSDYYILGDATAFAGGPMNFSLSFGGPQWRFTNMKFTTMGECQLADNTKFYYGTRATNGAPGEGAIYVSTSIKGPWKIVTTNITTWYLKQLVDKTFIAVSTDGSVWTAPNLNNLTTPTLTFTKATSTAIKYIIQLTDGSLAGVGSDSAVYTSVAPYTTWSITNKTNVKRVYQLASGTFAYVGTDGKLYQSNDLSGAKTVVSLTMASGDAATRSPDGQINLLYQDADGSLFIQGAFGGANGANRLFKAASLSGPWDFAWSNMWGGYFDGIARVSATRPMFYASVSTSLS